MPHSTDERSLRIRLLVSLSGAVCALVLAVAAAHFYAAPNLNGTARSNAWFELDFCLALASNLLAVGVGVYAGAIRGVRTPALSSALSRALSWFLLTLLLGAAWASAVALLTLLIAPSHAFAGLRLAALGRAWRSAWLWERPGTK